MPRVSTPKALPFVQLSHDHIDYWSVTDTGEWGADTALGRSYGRAFILHMVLHNQPILLGHVVSAMVEKRKFEGIETGFMHVIAERIVRGH